jgi:hypothetical protein
MATTTNYGWDTPDDTDLVKDGAAAIRTLGSSVDTTTKNLNPQTTTGALAYRSATANVNTALPIGTANQVLRVNSGGTAPEWATTADQTPLTTKGDLFGFDTADARIPIGANNTVLTADSSQSLGLKWAAPSSGGMTLLSTTTLSGADTINITGISGDYIDLEIHMFGITNATANGHLQIRFNASTTIASYFQTNATTTVTSSTGTIIYGNPENATMDFADANNAISIKVFNYANTTNYKNWYMAGHGVFSSTGRAFTGSGGLLTNSAITSLTLVKEGPRNFSTGTVKIYGVK